MFKTRLVYKVSSRTARAIQRNPVSKNKNQTNNKKCFEKKKRRRRKTNVWIICSFLEGGTSSPWKELQRQISGQRLKE